ncbi:hypothetical protein ACHWQZ_G017764 [Mnemiopsis leidyi]
MAEFAEGVPVTVQSMEDVNYTFNYTHMVMLHYTVNQLTVLRVVTLLLSILGLVGNLLVVLVILSRRRWRFANSMFVLNIAIANLFICAFTLPLITRALFEVDWKPAPQFCLLSGFLDNTAFACSAWSLALGSIERFFLVVFPMKHRELMKYQRAVMLSFLTWALSICLSVLPILGWNSYIYSPLTFSCGIDVNLPGAHSYYFLVYLTVVLPAPLIISTVSYSYILFYLRVHYSLKPQVLNRMALKKTEKSKKPSGESTTPENTDIFGSNMSELWRSPKRRSKNLKIVLPMILISIAFLLCFMPTVIVGFDIKINPGMENGQPKLKMIEYFIINLLLLGNSAMNPLIFTLCSPKFRSSGILVIKLLFDQFVLVLFYAVYVVYYAIASFFRAIWHYLVDLATSIGSCNTSCIKSVGKYDSLNDVVIKVTLTNSNDPGGQDKKKEDCCEVEGDLWGEKPRCHCHEEVTGSDTRDCTHGSEEGFGDTITPDNRTSETML